MERRDRQYIDMPALQERPITLGEILQREENREAAETAPPRPMGRTLSPNRCLGSLASGRPRRARGRILTGPSTSTYVHDEDSPGESEEIPQPRRRRKPFIYEVIAAPFLNRIRQERAEARVRNFLSFLNPSTETQEPRHGGLPINSIFGGWSSIDLPTDPLINQLVTRSRQGYQRRCHRPRSTVARSNPGAPRMVNFYNSRAAPRAAHRYQRATRSRSVRAGTEAEGNATNSNSGSDIPAAARRFINFTAEFIPVVERPPNAEPPEWSLNITAADLGPFAIGRTALSRSRSLAIIGALSQVHDDATDEQPNTNEN